MGIEYLFGSFVSENLSWSVVETIGYCLYLFIRNAIEISSFWEIPPYHSVRMLVGSTFP